MHNFIDDATLIIVALVILYSFFCAARRVARQLARIPFLKKLNSISVTGRKINGK